MTFRPNTKEGSVSLFRIPESVRQRVKRSGWIWVVGLLVVGLLGFVLVSLGWGLLALASWIAKTIG